MVRYRLGVDIGGTFTDFALIDDASGKVSVNKRTDCYNYPTII
jgi:N-methylhydantoinase A/oxoprolinase/acetone carboxylase beta subunit